jgi:DNA-binding NarL/FixJ family response regulator
MNVKNRLPMKSKLEHTWEQILICGEQFIFLSGLTMLLQRMGAAMRIMKAISEKDLKVKLKKNEKLDLLILVSPFFSNNGFKTLEIVQRVCKGTPVMVFAEEREWNTVTSLVKEGVKVVLSKSCTEEQLIEALNSLYRGKFYFTPEFNEIVFHKSLKMLSHKGHGMLKNITEREKEIIRMMWQDMTNKEIAQALNISTRTVESHRQHIYHKLKVNTLGGIFKFGLEEGIIV